MIYKEKTLTQEQDVVVSELKNGEDVKVKAPAGSGKTFVLGAGASQLKGKYGAYLAFNKAIADAAVKQFPSNVECRTGHSVAFRAVGHKYQHRLNRVTGTYLANTEDIGETDIYPTPASKGYLILETIRRFCYSDDVEVWLDHVPDIVGPYSKEAVSIMEEDIASYTQGIWDKMADIKGTLPITHDVYLKIWALSNPILHKHFILFDECQDANPVILGVLARQDHLQRIYVGDPFQQIYAWRGAVNAMDKITTASECYITQSFRFGQAIAGMANSILRGYMPPEKHPPLIRGMKGKESQVVMGHTGLPNVIISRTNAGVVNQAFRLMDKEVPVYIQGGVGQMISLLKGAKDLQEGKHTYVEELALFKNWEEVTEYSNTEEGSELKSFVTMVSKHGIPNLTGMLYKTEKTPESASITLTTAHKAKGLEWETVKLDNDFIAGKPGAKPLKQAEINILYVAATRALKTLDISKCSACHPESFTY